jgi:hypothetical protein
LRFRGTRCAVSDSPEKKGVGRRESRRLPELVIIAGVPIPLPVVTVPAMTVTVPMAADVQVDAWAVSILAIDATTGMAAMPMTPMPPTATSDRLCG